MYDIYIFVISWGYLEIEWARYTVRIIAPDVAAYMLSRLLQ